MQIILLFFLVLTAVSIIYLRDLFAVVIMAGFYGLISACFFVIMDAVDVAFTEAAVGVGISTLLMVTTLSLTGRYEKKYYQKKPRLRSWRPLLLVGLTGALLIYGTLDMPMIGDGSAPAHQHVAAHYLDKGQAETGMPNIVTAVLASYRGYDTFGELLVIFTAGIGVLALLGQHSADARDDVEQPAPMHHHKILRVVSKTLLPFILLFALYVQFHGDFGPGGGFQAGVIFASGILLYTMLFGLANARRLAPPTTLHWLASAGVLLYAAVGLVAMAAKGNFLDYDKLAEDPLAGQHLGILLIEFGVGLTVATVLILIFFVFTGRMAQREPGR